LQEDIKQTIDQLTSEYKIAQDKIDKIGAFRFTIRGWTVTLLTAVIVALASARILDHVLVAIVLALIALLLFQFGTMEGRQNRLQELFEDRAYTIEVEIRHLLRRMRGSPYPAIPIVTPRIAFLVKEHSTSTETWLRRMGDRHFYWILAAVALISIFAVFFFRPKQESNSTQPLSIHQIVQQSTTKSYQPEPRKGSTAGEPKEKHDKNPKASR
jgi:hypothetical protein